MTYNKETAKRKYIMWADDDGTIKMMEMGKEWHTSIPEQIRVWADMQKPNKSFDRVEPIDVLQRFVDGVIKPRLNKDEYEIFKGIINNLIDYNYALGIKQGKTKGREETVDNLIDLYEAEIDEPEDLWDKGYNAAFKKSIKVATEFLERGKNGRE